MEVLIADLTGAVFFFLVLGAGESRMIAPFLAGRARRHFCGEATVGMGSVVIVVGD